MTLASKIIADAQLILNDTGKVRWGDAELLGWLNAGQAEIARLRPLSSQRVESVQLVAGTKQSIPAGGFAFLGATRNLGTDGSTIGAAILPMTRQAMDSLLPGWHAADADTEILFSIYDPAASVKTFHVYPPALTTYIEIAYAVPPAAVATTASTITIDAIYENALLDYILYRAKLKSTEASDKTEATAIYARFLQALEG